jgi:class 3 adenylate cyclase
VLPIWVLPPILIVEGEKSDRFLAAAGIGVFTELAVLYVGEQPGSKVWRLMERWAAGERFDQKAAIESTYTYARTVVARAVVSYALAGGLMCVAVGAVAGANASRLAQYALLGAALFTAVNLIAIHPYVEAILRPVRIDIAANSGVGDALPRSKPSFAAWSNMSILAVAWAFTCAGAVLAAVIDRSSVYPAIAVVIATGMVVFYAVPITVGAAFAPSMKPIRDLAAGTERVASGDYSQRLPVVQDDDLGALAASFNRMQAGLAERERLHAAFGSYVDPALAERLLAQGDDLFQGEEVEVTVFFADIRNFTTYAEHASASEAVARLNALWDIIVPILRDHHGHANKFLGDGVLAVFGVPEELSDHADQAVAAAREIQQRVQDTFGHDLRIGIGINTGSVIAGTIGGGGKLEFTLIGDPVNVAARVEQLTKETGDSILLTQTTVDALHANSTDLAERGPHVVRGRDATVNIYAIDSIRA